MGRQGLSFCGGTCKENSAKTELYDPFKLIAEGEKGPVHFNRVMYCINHGCGWRLKLPAVPVSLQDILKGKSKGIASYLRHAQERFPGLLVKKLWQDWAQYGIGRFDIYLTEREGGYRG